jgi:hypothetical protein
MFRRKTVSLTKLLAAHPTDWSAMLKLRNTCSACAAKSVPPTNYPACDRYWNAEALLTLSISWPGFCTTSNIAKHVSPSRVIAQCVEASIGAPDFCKVRTCAAGLADMVRTAPQARRQARLRSATTCQSARASASCRSPATRARRRTRQQPDIYFYTIV